MVAPKAGVCYTESESINSNNMNNKIVGIIVAILVILAAIYFIGMRKDNDDNNKTESEISQQDSAEVESKPESMSLKDLAAANKNQTCTFSTTDSNYSSEGTIYTAGGKFRGDFKSTAQNQTTLSHMIYDSKDAYMWMDGSTTGFKLSIDAAAQADASKQSFDANQKLNYDCDSWSVDSSKFELPSNVQFNAMMDAGAQAPVTGSDPCASVPESVKAQCIAATKR